MVHMSSLETWEWGLKIFDGASTLTTHVDHLSSIHYKHRAQILRCHTIRLQRALVYVPSYDTSYEFPR